jgi:hypothetical protein
MYLLINLAMDGDWNKKEGFIAPADLQTTLVVDFIRAYSLIK